MGTLYIVSTPIGNLEDITIRALKVLSSVDIIVSEEPKATGLLLQLLKARFPEYFIAGRKEKIISCNEFEEEFKIYELLKLLDDGTKIAFVSQAGTPLISDPGFKLVREAQKNDIEVIAIPGVSAPITAISISGLPSDKFFFLGFLPKSEEKSRKKLADLQNMLGVSKENNIPTLILFESPHRITQTLKILKDVFGNINIVVARELTKKFEEVQNKKISEFINLYDNKPPKGELTLLFNTKTQ